MLKGDENDVQTLFFYLKSIPRKDTRDIFVIRRFLEFDSLGLFSSRHLHLRKQGMIALKAAIFQLFRRSNRRYTRLPRSTFYSLCICPLARVQDPQISKNKNWGGQLKIRSTAPRILNPSCSFTRCTGSFLSSCTSAKTVNFDNLDSVYRPVKAHLVQAKSGAGNERFWLRLETVWTGESGSCLVTCFWNG